jgi:galactokinase
MPARRFAAPGRINLIGEHTDYNDGLVLPMAIDRSTVVAAVARPDREVHVTTAWRSAAASFSLDDEPAQASGEWLSYVHGMAACLEHAGIELRGAELHIESDIPVGAGLSSSAALELAVGRALLGLADREVAAAELARLAQQAEHRYAGTRCGIMDQLASACGVAGHALLIDCATLALEPVPIPESAVLLVCDTGVRHALATSAYNTRRDECEAALARLRALQPELRSLSEGNAALLARAGLPRPLQQRAAHVVSENARVRATASALAAGELREVGRLMHASHVSLRDDYEVSCDELDVLVEAGLRSPHVLGARMTGGGFGGSAIALVERASVAAAEQDLVQAFAARFGRKPPVFAVTASDGAREISPG